MSVSDRSHDRIDVEGRIDAVLCHDGLEPPIEVMNLSLTGAALRAEEPIGSVLDRAELRIRCGGQDEWVSCPCQLRYIIGENQPAGEPAWLHGVKFVDLDEQISANLDRLLGSGPA